MNKLLRGIRGQFISKKKIEEKNLNFLDPVVMTFYGKNIRKFIVKDKSYFSIEDILTLATPIDISKDTIAFTEDYEKVKSEVEKFVGQIPIADPEGILKLIREVIGVFPGPLARWLDIKPLPQSLL